MARKKEFIDGDFLIVSRPGLPARPAIVNNPFAEGGIGVMYQDESSDVVPAEFVEFEMHTVFMAYGNFTEPTTGKNFIVLRMPRKGVPWNKKIVPAINKIVKPWMDDSDQRWNVDGDIAHYPWEPRLWDTKLTLRFDWVDGKFVQVEQNR